MKNNLPYKVFVGRKTKDGVEYVKMNNRPIEFDSEKDAKDWLFLEGYNEPIINSLIYQKVPKGI